MDKLLDFILSVLGLGVLYEGWRRFQSGVPKPTQNKKVTRADYLSGNYQEQLDEREDQLRSNKKQGLAYMGFGIGFIVASVYLLFRLVKSASEVE